MRAFFANMHPSFSHSLNIMLQRGGYEVLTPNQDFVDDMKLSQVGEGQYTNITTIDLPNAQQISHEEYLDLKPEIVFLLCIEQELGRWWQLVYDPRDPKPTVIHYAGNDGTPYRPERVQWLIAADTTTLRRIAPAPGRGLEFYPILPFDEWPHDKDRALHCPHVIRSYVVGLVKHWPRGNYEFHELKQYLQDIKNPPKLENMERLSRDEVRTAMRNSMATLHFKDAEGYGYAVIESLALGVPVIAPRWLVSGRTMERFIKHGHSGWLVDTAYDALSIIQTLDSMDSELLKHFSQTSAEHIRSIINEEEQITKLHEFLQKAVQSQ
jgi:hypothetical protein